MAVVRQAGALLLAALLTSRGLFAQDPVDSATAPAPLPSLPAGAAATVPVDQLKVLLRPTEIRYVQQESVLLPPTANIKALYVNAWAFGSPKLWQLVRLADETEINAFVIDVKDDTGCLLYPSAVPTAEQIGANQCTRAKDARPARYPQRPRHLPDRTHRGRERSLAGRAEAALVGQESRDGRPVARSDRHRLGRRLQRLRVDLRRADRSGSGAAGLPGGAVRLRALPRRAARAHGDGDLSGASPG